MNQFHMVIILPPGQLFFTRICFLCRL
jgi:hypothetical protein